MASLLAKTITVADSTGTPGPVKKLLNPEAAHLTVEAIFVYGSGGTTVDAYLQTSLDQGASWIDVANFHFTTSSLKKVINLSAATPVTTQVTPSDGSMTANTAQDGVFGDQWRVKTGSSGTYAGGTTLAVLANGARLTS